MTMEKKKSPKTSKKPETPETSKTPKTPKPRKPKAPSGDQINVENQGERNVIAAGRNARATAFNFNIRDFKWQPVVIVLVVVGALLAAILWYVIPKQAKEMTGQFNVAVAEFTVQDANGKTIRGKDGSLLAAYVEKQIVSQFTEIELNKNIPYDVWGPDKTGVVNGDTPEERLSNAAALAEKIHAHVLIYGTVISDGNRSRFMPEFYVNHASFQDASEITGEHEIGSEVKLSLPFLDSIQAVENPGLAGRVNALDLITIGLAYYSVDDFENAAHYLEQAAAEDRWLEISGKEVAYLLVGNAYVRWASREDDSKYLTDAAKNYAEALRINPNYGRGLVGQANVLYLEALGPLDHPQIDPAKLDEADARVTQALELEGQPESANIQAKARFNRGQIDLARFSAKVPGEDWLARAKEEFLFVTQDYESGDTTLESLAAHSYFRLGIIAYFQGEPDSGISLIQKAIPLASPFSQGEFTAMLGDIYANLGRKEDAAKAYEDAISIAVSLGDEKSAQKYQSKLNGLNAPPVTPTAAVTLPPLPDFSTHLYFQFGGGADESCDPTVQIDYYSNRSGRFCVFDVPLDMDFHISLTSPDGEVTLNGDFKAVDSPDGPKVLWVGHENEEHYTEIYLNEDGTAYVRFKLWWAGNLPAGDWKSQVAWEGNETNDVFKVPASTQPEIYLLDLSSTTDIQLSSTQYSSCHRVDDPENVSIGGNNFPPGEVIYLLVYQKMPEEGWLTQKAAQQAILADSEGKFETVLNESLSPGGEYVMIAGTSNDFVDSNVEESILDPSNIGNAFDCFIVQ